MKCPKCGRIIDDDSKYCDYCGTKVLQVNTLKKEPQLVESNSLPEQDEGLQKHEKWLGIIVILLPLLVVSILAYLDKNPNGTGSNELNLVDTVAMADTITMADQQIDYSILEFMTYIKVVAEKATLRAQGWVDLGLPSGTLWKDQNEEGSYNYGEAVGKFGDSLPTKEQFEELEDKCTWAWTGEGYQVEGPNGNHFFLPALRAAVSEDSVYYHVNGSYWSSTPSGSEEAWNLNFFSSVVRIENEGCWVYNSVRLVR